MKHIIVQLPITDGIVLYMARIDCHLISGADIFLNVDTALIQEIQQHLKVHSCATSWDLAPPTCRHYMDSLGDDSDRVVHAAFLDSVDLFRTGFTGWAGDLAIMLGTLPTPICVVPADFLSIPTIEAIMVELSTKLIPSSHVAAVTGFRTPWHLSTHYLPVCDYTSSHPLAHRRLSIRL
ncbi:hypothetical protein DFH09DRAFT_1315855 [Mycena vulgaris]|nr:hypothetical protein DFH09DRAFT_1315855 [Mycena vulgaris]